MTEALQAFGWVIIPIILALGSIFLAMIRSVNNTIAELRKSYEEHRQQPIHPVAGRELSFVQAEVKELQRRMHELERKIDRICEKT